MMALTTLRADPPNCSCAMAVAAVATQAATASQPAANVNQSLNSR